MEPGLSSRGIIPAGDCPASFADIDYRRAWLCLPRILQI